MTDFQTLVAEIQRLAAAEAQPRGLTEKQRLSNKETLAWINETGSPARLHADPLICAEACRGVKARTAARLAHRAESTGHND